MSRSMGVLVLVIVSISFASIAYAKHGTATFYTSYIPSACYGNKHEGVMIGAASDAIWDGGAACGTHYKVKCTGATNQGPHPCKKGHSVVVKIVDYCPNCEGTIDLSEQAFSAIANTDAGKVKIQFDRH